MSAPDILGASTGAAFGAALSILLQKSYMEITAWAFISSMICVLLVLFVSRLCKGNQILNLILAGIMVGSLFSAGTSYIKLIADPNNTLPAITFWMMGSLSGADTAKMSYIWIPILIGMVPIFVLRWKINILTLDDDEAKTMGINTRLTRTIVIISATLLTAASVSVSGMIGWVGLVMPHVARKLVGDDCRILIPAAALVGGIFLVLTDDICRTLYTTEVPLGILTSLIGAPFFIYLMIRARE
jgi:iron complex transport system permease protein